ncbi:MAG: TPR repeat protein, partial [Alphaproteobacteria bacterium]
VGVCVLFGGWGFFTWRLSNGLMLVPTAPEILDGIVFGYVLLAAAALLAVGWLPRMLLPANDGLTETLTTAEPKAVAEEDLYQPLYPGLSFDQQYQPTSSQPPAPEPEAPVHQEPPTVIEDRRRPRRRLVFAAGVAVLVVGALGIFVVPSSPAANQRFDLAAMAANFKGLFANGSGDVIRDDALDFQKSGTEMRDGDFAFDVDRWRPLAKQGNAGAQYKLGVMYANGRGVSRDYIEAYKWLNIAGAQSNARAVEGRDAVARKMTPAQVETAQNLAREEFSLISSGGTFSGEVPARLTAMTKRQLVSEAQRLLNARGYNVGLADGLAGRRTHAAVRQFERQGDLPETGKVTPEIVARLERRGRDNSRPTARSGPGLVLYPPSYRPSARAETTAPRPLKVRAAPATECDTLAAHPSNSVGSAGVIFARIDADRAIPACQSAIERYPDEVRFQFQLARSLHKAERHNEALTLYSKVGAQGFAFAQRSVGFMYANANGVGQDLTKAATWLRQAADRCDVDAQFALGTLYAKGQGIEKNETESLRWFRIAAAQNHPDARAHLEGRANLNGGQSVGDNQTSTGPRGKFGLADYTVGHHLDRLLINQKHEIVDAFERRNFQAVLELLRPAAEQGVASAQTLLGYMYSAGMGVGQDDTKAVEWYRKAAELDDPDAQFLLGYMHQRGLGVSLYFARALQLYRKSAVQGVSAARVALGVMYDNGEGVARDRDAAVAHYFSAAEAGLAAAQHSLATAYESGDGVPRDFDEAIKWYRLAADQNFAPSQNGLGEMYSQGRGVPRDSEEAIKWYRLAAEQGLPAAQFNLAKIVGAGRGVPGNTSEAVKLFEVAAEQGHSESQVKLAFAYLKGRGVDRSHSDAVTWFQRAATQCNADAQFQLANMHRLGQGGVKASAAAEMKWLKLAAEQGHTEALQTLSVRYAIGQGVQKNPAMAYKSAQRAAQQGHPTAQFGLAELYAKGSDEIPQDYAKAAEWYRKAALQGNREAQFNLAELYRAGLGVARSNVEAVAWYRLAAEQGNPVAQHNLALAYRLGAGVERDNGEAVSWNRLAAEQGEPNSQRDLGLQYLRGEGVLQDFVRARLWLGRAAANGDTAAGKALGRLVKKMTPNQVAGAERLEKETPGSDG